MYILNITMMINQEKSLEVMKKYKGKAGRVLSGRVGTEGNIYIRIMFMKKKVKT